MQIALIVSFIADDRPGLTETVSTLVADHGGNWEDARLVRLGGKFAGLMLVSLPSAQADTFTAALAALAEQGIDARVTPAGEESDGAAEIQLDILGPDRPGIVREITRALNNAGINIHSMESRVTPAPMSGEALFTARILAAAPDTTAEIDLRRALDAVAEATTLDIDIAQLSS
ncbi:MAG: ACT domain-containing protein [Chromatocurvus sp.]